MKLHYIEEAHEQEKEALRVQVERVRVDEERISFEMERLRIQMLKEDERIGIEKERLVVSMGCSLFRKLLFDDSDEDEIMNRRLKSSTSQRKHRRYIRCNHLAVRMLAYGVVTDLMDEYVQIGESATMESLKKFVATVVDIFSEEYLRSPNNEDIAKLLAHGENRGFSGMLGSIDCMQWKWKNCPIAYKGQFSGYIRVPTIILEAVASYDLCIWHDFFWVTWVK
ncbi:uncharacterized protein LOC126699511 [Quercus robur]|uniref:uncharacterized protein LOC126699511 n=1 Tax=Quercus robur TaxID=38942 RepID=UPI00216117B7|nr:uncharacterized protein LOC126699511 [Quercus robur]